MRSTVQWRALRIRCCSLAKYEADRSGFGTLPAPAAENRTTWSTPAATAASMAAMICLARRPGRRSEVGMSSSRSSPL
jgi:hypothetical protein